MTHNELFESTIGLFRIFSIQSRTVNVHKIGIPNKVFLDCFSHAPDIATFYSLSHPHRTRNWLHAALDYDKHTPPSNSRAISNIPNADERENTVDRIVQFMGVATLIKYSVCLFGYTP